MDDNQKLIQAFLKKAKQGDFSTGDLIDENRKLSSQALNARDLAEGGLASEVLKNTGIPIPGKEASISKQEDFLSRLMKERYPELDPNIRIGNLEKYKATGLYNPQGPGDKHIIGVSHKLIDQGPESMVGTMLHEAGHQYDDKITGVSPHNPIEFKKMYLKAINEPNRIDPTELYDELASAGHHNYIPKLREGSFGLGALKSLLKSGNFKSLAPPIIGGLATAAMTGDASAAVPGLGDTETVGDPNEDRIMRGEDKSRKDLANIEKSDVPKEVKLKALELYRKNNIY